MAILELEPVQSIMTTTLGDNSIDCLVDINPDVIVPSHCTGFRRHAFHVLMKITVALGLAVRVLLTSPSEPRVRRTGCAVRPASGRQTDWPVATGILPARTQ